MAPNDYVTTRSQKRTIAMLRRKLRNAKSCINKYRYKVVEIVQFVEDTDFDDNEDILLSKNFVIEKSNEILDMTLENNEYIDETDIEEAETDIEEFTDSECDDETDIEEAENEVEEFTDSECDDKTDIEEAENEVEEFTDSECDDSDSDEEMFDAEESQYIFDPAIVNNFDENEYVDMPPLIDLTNEESDDENCYDEDCDNPLHYNYSHLNNEIHRFENITINGVHYFHDKYGNVTGCQNLLLVFDSNGDLEAVDIYKPNLNIDISQSVLI